MENLSIEQIWNTPGLWLASSLMVIAVILQSIIFLKTSLKQANKIGLEKKRVMAGMRSAAITAVGPSFSPVIVLMSMIIIVGAPTTWMRLCDVGAARTEIAMITIATGAFDMPPGSEAFGVEAFGIAIWAMAVNNLGWFTVALLLTHRMSGIVDKLYIKYNPAWIKLLMWGTIIGLFSFLLSNQLVPAMNNGNWAVIVAAMAAACAMWIITKLFSKIQILQELALGLAMLTGMFTAQALFG